MANLSNWVAIFDPLTQRTYYANIKTRVTQWHPPANFESDSQFQYNPIYSTRNLKQPPTGLISDLDFQLQQNPLFRDNMQGSSTCSFLTQEILGWKKLYDTKSGKCYWYHASTKKVSWSNPSKLSTQSGNNITKKSSNIRLRRQPITQIQTTWQNSGEKENNKEDKDNNSWDDDNNDSKNEDNVDKSDNKSDDGLEGVNANKANILITTVVRDDSDDSDDEEDEKKEREGEGEGEEEGEGEGEGRGEGGNVYRGSDDYDYDDSEIVTQDTINKYKEIGKYSADKYKMEEYGNINFQKDKHKKGIFGKQTVADLLKFASYRTVQNAIRKMDAKLNVQAKQIWKNITSYMGDRKSSKNKEEHINKLLETALKAPAELRDEIYIQLCKQTNSNPKYSSLIKGWKLMAVCTSIFPPSDEFSYYLAVYLHSHIINTGGVGKYAQFALENLDRTMESGRREVQPLPNEIQKLEYREPILVQVFFLDQSYRSVKITSQTRVSQVCEAIAKTLHITHDKSYGLFEMEEPSPEEVRNIHKRRVYMDIQEKIDELPSMPYSRELELNECIMDIISSWVRSKKKSSRKIRLIYKCKLQSKTQETSYSTNEWKFSFLTAVWHVLHGYYPVDEENAYKLAALQLQASCGLREKGFYAPGIVFDVIYKYIPWNYLIDGPSKIEHKILNYHKQYKHLDKRDAYRKYIEILRNNDNISKYFGNYFFRCVCISKLKQKTTDLEDLLVGISENGIIFVNPLTFEILEKYKMKEILSYDFQSNTFSIVVGTLMTQQKYQLVTTLAKEINDLLHQYIKLYIQQDKVQEYQTQM